LSVALAFTVLTPLSLKIVNFPEEFNKTSKEEHPKSLKGIRSPFNLKYSPVIITNSIVYGVEK